MTKKFNRYLIGIIYFILSLFVSAANDIIVKYLDIRLHPFEISFFRFFFSTITLIPFFFISKKNLLKTNNPTIHIIRGILLFFAMTFWIYGLSNAPLTNATIISFTTPLFTLVLAALFLKEKIIWQRWTATILGFIGILVIVYPNQTTFNLHVLFFIFAALIFGMLDVINKKYISTESITSMLFYSALVTSILSFPTLIIYWKTPTIIEYILLILLGAGGSIILFLLLKSYTIVDASATAPYRYMELIISSIAGYIIFSEIPTNTTIYGAIIIIPSTFFIIYSEKKYFNDSK